MPQLERLLEKVRLLRAQVDSTATEEPRLRVLLSHVCTCEEALEVALGELLRPRIQPLPVPGGNGCTGGAVLGATRDATGEPLASDRQDAPAC